MLSSEFDYINIDDNCREKNCNFSAIYYSIKSMHTYLYTIYKKNW